LKKHFKNIIGLLFPNSVPNLHAHSEVEFSKNRPWAHGPKALGPRPWPQGPWALGPRPMTLPPHHPPEKKSYNLHNMAPNETDCFIDTLGNVLSNTYQTQLFAPDPQN